MESNPRAISSIPLAGGFTGSGQNLSKKKIPVIKTHNFKKINQFKQPTWCVFSNIFIWGLDKSGYECTDCCIASSRKGIQEAKKTLCEVPDPSSILFSSRPREEDAMQSKDFYTKTKIFTVHLPEGAKKSVLLNPMQKLSDVLYKVCHSRDWQMNDYIPRDVNGVELSPHVLLGNIKGFEITYTPREAPSTSWGRPPLISDVKAKMEADGLLISKQKLTSAQHIIKKEKHVNIIIASHDDSVDQESLHQADDESQCSVKDLYEMIEEVGTGAFASVWKAQHKRTEQPVAIKIIEKKEDRTEHQKRKFRHEINIHSSLSHPNIINFYRIDETDTQYIVVMELVSGGELFDQIIARSQFLELDAARLICQVLTALQYIHSRGVAHRDLKPENLLFTDTSYKRLKIVDFGESKSFRDQPNGSLHSYCGTPDYMAPEIIRSKAYDCCVDMWALGVITYVMMAGFPPFDGETEAEVMGSILAVKYDFPSPEWDDYSHDAKLFISQLILEKPESRLTAPTALNHPWIVKHTTVEERSVKGDEVQVKQNSPSAANKSTSPIKESPSLEDVPLFQFDCVVAPEANSAKAHLLRGIDVLFKLNTKDDFEQPFLVPSLQTELAFLQNLIKPVSDQGKLRDEYQMHVIRHVWERIQFLNQQYFAGREDGYNDHVDFSKKKKHSSGHLFVQKVKRKSRTDMKAGALTSRDSGAKSS